LCGGLFCDEQESLVRIYSHMIAGGDDFERVLIEISHHRDAVDDASEIPREDDLHRRQGGPVRMIHPDPAACPVKMRLIQDELPILQEHRDFWGGLYYIGGLTFEIPL